MEFGSVYHRTSAPYCYAENERQLVIQLQTGHDVQRVYLYQGDPFQAGILGGNEKWQGERTEIVACKKCRHHLWWTSALEPPYKRCRYYFELCTAQDHVFYFEDGFYTQEEMEREGKRLSYFIFPWMNEADILKAPAWVAGTVWYQIFPERFCKGNPALHPDKVRPWKYEQVKNAYFYGGDLPGILSKLSYLQELGVDGIYLNPIFEATSSHKYDTKDYYKVDPCFGSEKDLKDLVQKAHARRIRVMLDAVFNHTGPDIAMWQDVLKNGKQSAFADWYMIHKWPVEMGGSTADGRYASFAFSDRMPKLNTNHPEVIRYLLDVVDFWIREFDVDGLRLDVGNEVSHQFLKELRKLCRERKPDFYLLGEVWHDAIDWLRGDEYDAVMNYPLASAISDFWLYPERTREDFESALNRCLTMYMRQSLRVMLNLLDSHDTNRLINQVGGNRDIFYQQLAVLFTMPGSPCIYYGTEIVMEGGYDPDCRRCMPWDQIERGDYREEQEEMKKLIRLRKRFPAFRSTNIEFSNRTTNRRVVEYYKWEEEGQGILVALNCGDTAVTIPDGEAAQEGRELYSRNWKESCLEPKGILILRVGTDQEENG